MKTVKWRLASASVAALALGSAFVLRPHLDEAAGADDSAGRAVLENAVASLRPRPGLDTYPVEFSIGSIAYRIPRNYLTTMDNWDGGPQILVTLTVNLPDLKPLSPETLGCFRAKPLERSPGCEPLSFNIEQPSQPTALTAFENMTKALRNPAPINGPYGFEKYEIGPEDGRSEYYRRIENGITFLYFCLPFDRHDGVRDAVCSPVGDHTPSGPTIHFFFDLKHFADITQVDTNLRKLVEMFVVRPGAKQ